MLICSVQSDYEFSWLAVDFLDHDDFRRKLHDRLYPICPRDVRACALVEEGASPPLVLKVIPAVQLHIRPSVYARPTPWGMPIYMLNMNERTGRGKVSSSAHSTDPS